VSKGEIIMYCHQCEETAKGVACDKLGMCGKVSEVSDLQDTLVYIVKGIAARNLPLIERGTVDPKINTFIVQALFMTLTNVNFDPNAINKMITEGIAIRDALPLPKKAPLAATYVPKDGEDVVHTIGVLADSNPDVRSLHEIILYGLKGMAAYYTHCLALGYEDPAIPAFIQKVLYATLTESSIDALIKLVQECGSVGVTTLALLDKAHTETFGHPKAAIVSRNVGTRPGILITGHDMHDMHQLLEQSKGAGVDIYTHGEMLPAHGYPKLAAYSHLVGHYGGSWPHQKTEFKKFNGPIVVTTNCIVPPDDSYISRIYTTNEVGFPGVARIPIKQDGSKDFSTVIEQAKKLQPPTFLDSANSHLITGYGHDTVLRIADTVINAVKSGAVKRFIVMAGCDGRHKEREYYTEIAKALPQDTIILTAGCAKYRYNDLNLGDIGGIPRVLDAGQCNDSYSLVVIAMELAKAFNTDINSLPISYDIAWYEQKAVLVLLCLLSLGVQNIILGPKLPAFVSPNVLQTLISAYNIQGIGTVEDDVKAIV
jgi:hydroxylamine reductase